MGSVVDFFGAIRKKGGPLLEGIGSKISSIKLYILGIIFICALGSIQIAWVFDPMVIMARFVSLNLIPTITSLLNSFFIAMIKVFPMHEPVRDFYHTLKDSILGVNIYYFSNSLIIFLFFLFICSTTFFLSRFWCRGLCPLGALYSLITRFSFLRRVVEKCTHCQKCVSNCRMGAIKDEENYIKPECVLCMDCVYSCPTNKTKFSFVSEKRKQDKKRNSDNGISRRNFLVLMTSSFFLLGFKKTKEQSDEVDIIRPPGALKEGAFVDRCIRCGNCMKVCVTNVIQPAMLESGLQGIWTPRLIPEIAYCEYNCNLCGNVCPTGAIPSLSVEVKKKTKLGIATVNRSICLAWEHKEECIVCEEHCPVPDKAIKLIEEVVKGKKIFKPYVDKNMCIGCAICQNKCPVRPARAIIVYGRYADRT